MEPTPRPVCSVVIDGAVHAPLFCLVDTGSLRSRFPVWLATLLGIDLSGAPEETFSVGGQPSVTARQARVRLFVTEIGREVECGVWFCEPWDLGFGLLGQEDFLRLFRLTLSSARGRFSLEPETA
jgi:hypothetical protein